MEKVHEKIVELIADCLSVPEGEVTPTAKLEDDLGADSLDLVELIMTIEEHFECEIADEEAEKLATVQDCFDYADNQDLGK